MWSPIWPEICLTFSCGRFQEFIENSEFVHKFERGEDE